MGEVCAAPTEGVLAVGATILDAAELDTLTDELLALDVAAELLLEATLLDDTEEEVLLDAALLDVAEDEVLLDASLLETDELAAALLTETALLEAPLPAAGALSLPPPQAEISARLNAANPASLYCLFIAQSLYKNDAVLLTWTALRRYVSDFLQMESGDIVTTCAKHTYKNGCYCACFQALPRVLALKSAPRWGAPGHFFPFGYSD